MTWIGAHEGSKFRMIRNDMLLTRDSLETCTALLPSPVESQQLVLV